MRKTQNFCENESKVSRNSVQRAINSFICSIEYSIYLFFENFMVSAKDILIRIYLGVFIHVIFLLHVINHFSNKNTNDPFPFQQIPQTLPITHQKERNSLKNTKQRSRKPKLL